MSAAIPTSDARRTVPAELAKARFIAACDRAIARSYEIEKCLEALRDITRR